MPVITEIADLKRLYRRRVPKMFYDYCETGSWSQQTFRENTSDFDQLYFRQRVAVDMSERSTATTLASQEVAMPAAIAPIGMLGMQSADGEIKAARAAEEFGVPFTLSTLSICSIEDVAERTTKPFWFQVYTLTDSEFMTRLFARARDAGVETIVLTLDLQLQGQRHKDIKNGLSAPPRLTLPTLANLATKVPWGLEMLGTPRRTFRNVVGHAQGVTDARSLTDWTGQALDKSLDWDRVAELRRMWKGRVIIKGVMDAADAQKAVDAGADGIVVSNHGGRQLDGALSSIRALEPVVEAVGNKTDVMFDSGIRSGQDILKALALGAKGVMVGRSVVYGLGAMGQKGVTEALNVLQKELEHTMALVGRTSIDAIDRDILLVPKGFAGDWDR